MVDSPPQGGNWQPQNPWQGQWGSQQAYNYPAYQTQQQTVYNPPAEMPQPQNLLSKDIPITYVVMGTLVVWILIFGGVFGYMFTQPCQFVALTSGGEDTLQKLEETNGLDLHNNTADCTAFVRQTIMGQPAAATAQT